MNLGRSVFAQLISFLPDREFRRCVSRYDGDRRWRGFSCWDQFLGMAFAQLTYRESLRDIEACLRSLGAKLYHMGFRSPVARSTLADANESRDWRIYADFAQVLIRIARPLYARDPIGVGLDQSLYALDSTTIDLCLSLFPWAKFRRRKAAVKMHTLLDLRGNPHQVAEVADALEFEHKYTSGVIAWAPEDKPSDAQIGRVLDEFEKTAWAGLEPDRYAWSAIEHREAGGGVHVHVLAARCDLETGKSLNIAAPGWQKTFDALRDWQNHENGWSRPDDPERARDVQPGHRAYIEAAQLRAGLEAEKDPRRLITDYLSQGIETGAVSDRATMVSALQRAGLEVPRQGEHYLTAADPESGGKWRLKGAIYERDFQR